jgi:hypothetical protein
VRFGKSDKIQFISTVEGLESIEECLPRPAKYFIPKWFKDISSDAKSTVRDCPSFPDYFSQGYIIPMWSDVRMKFENQVPRFELSAKRFSFDVHGNLLWAKDEADAYAEGIDEVVKLIKERMPKKK